MTRFTQEDFEQWHDDGVAPHGMATCVCSTCRGEWLAAVEHYSRDEPPEYHPDYCPFCEARSAEEAAAVRDIMRWPGGIPGVPHDWRPAA